MITMATNGTLFKHLLLLGVPPCSLYRALSSFGYDRRKPQHLISSQFFWCLLKGVRCSHLFLVSKYMVFIASKDRILASIFN